MTLVRNLVAAFGASDDPLLGLYGAFAYDLVFQIVDLKQKRARGDDQRDIVLYVPDRLLAYDRATGRDLPLSVNCTCTRPLCTTNIDEPSSPARMSVSPGAKTCPTVAIAS